MAARVGLVDGEDVVRHTYFVLPACLFDASGFMWPTVSELRSAASPMAVEAEMRAQVKAAVNSGIDVTHLDHHMGAAPSPEFVEHSVDIAVDLNLPMLFPRDIESMLSVIEMGPVDLSLIRRAWERAERR